MSRSDFLADKKKAWRSEGGVGMGDFRVFVTPKGLLQPEDIPYGWMLWEVHGKSKPTLKIIKGEAKTLKYNPSWGCKSAFFELLNCDREEYLYFCKSHTERDYRQSLTWMLKVMSRAMDDGFEPNNYANNYQDKV